MKAELLPQTAQDSSEALYSGIGEVLGAFTSQSGLEFYCGEDGRENGILPPKWIVGEISDDALLEWATNRYHLPQSLLDDSSLRSQLLAEARESWSGHFDGGAGGVTARDIDQTNKELPGLAQALEATRGKVVVLGAGFSELPILLAQRYEEGLLSEPAVVDDLFSYKLAQADLEEVRDRCAAAGIPYPFQKALERSTRISHAIETGSIKAVAHMMGSARTPSELLGASLVINEHGPRTDSIKYELALLAKGGSLFTTYPTNEVMPTGFLATETEGSLRIVHEAA